MPPVHWSRNKKRSPPAEQCLLRRFLHQHLRCGKLTSHRPGWLIGWLWLAGVWTRKDVVVYYISSLKVPYAMGDGHVLLDFVHKQKYSQSKVFLQSRSHNFPSFRDDWGVIRVIVPGNSCWNHQTVLVWLLSRPLKNDVCSAMAGPPGSMPLLPSQWASDTVKAELHDININRYVCIYI